VNTLITQTSHHKLNHADDYAPILNNIQRLSAGSLSARKRNKTETEREKKKKKKKKKKKTKTKTNERKKQ